MKVCLLEDVQKTGKKGEILEVSEGFGRYLINHKQATYVTAEVVKRMQQQQIKEKEKSISELQKMQEMAAKLDGEEVEIESSNKKQGAFYSAITAKEICKAIRDQLTVTVKPDQIRMKKPLKEAGEYDIVIAFKHGLEAEVKVIVS